MGPWLCSHGNVQVQERRADLFALLQWGRGCVATEIHGPGDPGIRPGGGFNGAVAV